VGSIKEPEDRVMERKRKRSLMAGTMECGGDVCE